MTCWRFTVAAIVLFTLSGAASARDAAFIDPGSSVGAVTTGDAIRVEPKNEIEIGDATQNIARRTTLFFVNQTTAPIKIEKTVVNSDSNVTAEIANDDCSKQGTLTPASRCSLEVVLTPTAAGPWSAELLMTHNGSGRLTRAKISGKTASSGAGDKRDSGLFLSSKDIKPIDFGEVTIGEGKIVRSALMVNDSPTPITLYSIDVIEADNGLQRLEQGCAVDMELKPGESCPVTMIWTPNDRGRISTDLIIRHSGQLGFAVIPIRGTAKGDATAGGKDSGAKNASASSAMSSLPLPGSASDLNKLSSSVPAISSSALAVSGNAAAAVSSGEVHLIGTVGNRALIYKPDGTTVVVQVGDDIDFGAHTAKVITIGTKEVSITTDGKTKKLTLQAVQELTDKARSLKQQAAASSAPIVETKVEASQPSAAAGGGAK